MPAARRVTRTVSREYFERLASLVAGPGVYICERCTREATLLAADPDAKPAHTRLAVVPASQEDTACSFCGEPTGPNRLVAGPHAVICSQCLVLCREITPEDEPPDN
jgi:ATP-dependent protease Clp ATPase subunit